MKDRDISGELKDVWNAVQVQREKDRDEAFKKQRFSTIETISNSEKNISSSTTNTQLDSSKLCSQTNDFAEIKETLENTAVSNCQKNTNSLQNTSIDLVENKKEKRISIIPNGVFFSNIKNKRIFCNIKKENTNDSTMLESNFESLHLDEFENNSL